MTILFLRVHCNPSAWGLRHLCILLHPDHKFAHTQNYIFVFRCGKFAHMAAHYKMGLLLGDSLRQALRLASWFGSEQVLGIAVEVAASIVVLGTLLDQYS